MADDTPLTPDERSDRRQAADDRASDNADRREVSDVRASDNADRRQVSDVNASAKADRREKTDRKRLAADKRGIYLASAVIVVSLGVIGTGIAAYIVTDNAVDGQRATNERQDVTDAELAGTQRELAATQRTAAQNTARLDHLTQRLHAAECGDAYLWLGILEASEVQEPGEPEPTEQDLKTRREFRAQQLGTIERLQCPPPLENGGTS